MIAIRKIRKWRGLSQAELANNINMTTSTIRNYEKENSYIPYHRLIKIAEALDVSIKKIQDEEANNNV